MGGCGAGVRPGRGRRCHGLQHAGSAAARPSQCATVSLCLASGNAARLKSPLHLRACAGGLPQPSRVAVIIAGHHVWAVATSPTQAERAARRPGWPARAHGRAAADGLPVRLVDVCTESRLSTPRAPRSRRLVYFSRVGFTPGESAADSQRNFWARQRSTAFSRELLQASRQSAHTVRTQC